VDEWANADFLASKILAGKEEGKNHFPLGDVCTRGNLAKSTLELGLATPRQNAELGQYRKILTENFRKSYPDPSSFPIAHVATGCKTRNAWSASLGFVTDGDHASRVRPGVAIAAREPTQTGAEAASGRLRFSIAGRAN